MNIKVLLILFVLISLISKAQSHKESELNIRLDILKKLYTGESIYHEKTLRSLFIADEKSKLILDEIKSYDAKNSFINSDYFSTNGIIGENYQRIQIFIKKVEKSKDKPLQYNVYGKSKVKDNICNFSGTLTIVNALPNDPEDFVFPSAMKLIATYKFYEDSSNNSSGYFEGVYSGDFYLDRRRKLMIIDETLGCADSYENNTYVGAWTSYKSGKSKKCIWGDGRIPYTQGFDSGVGDMHVTEEYEKNGWENFNNRSEWEEKDGIWQEKDKWWLK